MTEDEFNLLKAKSEHRDRYLPKFEKADVEKNLIIAELNNSLIVHFPPYLGQETSKLSVEQLAQVQLSPGKYALIWESEGVGIEASSLLAGRFGSRKWMEKLHAELGIPLGRWSDCELT